MMGMVSYSDQWDQEREDYLNTQIELKLANVRASKDEENWAQDRFEREYFGKGM